MYLGVDIGGTKTLLGVFTKDGQLKEKFRFETPQNYATFLAVFRRHVEPLLGQGVDAVGVGAPGRIDREQGVGIRFGNLAWKNTPLQKDIESITNAPTIVENDAKVAGLYEAFNIINDFKKVLYITIGTGIGICVVVNGIIDTELGDGGGHSMFFDHHGEKKSWEDFASGKAITKKYGKKASDITDQSAWRSIARNLSVGILDLLAIIEPEVVVIGGGVGSQFTKFEAPLLQELKKYETPSLPIPPLRPAKKPEEAAIYGCFELVRQKYGKIS